MSTGDLAALLQYDQLKIQQAAGNTFVHYVEGDITFPPTYKYDLFSDDYDTSEKCRAPAWTDRVLFRKRRDPHGTNPGKFVYYGRAELKQSDHRPVMAFIDVDILETNMDRARTVLEDVVGRLGPPDATVVVQVHGKGEDEADQTSWADDDSLLTIMLSRVSQAAGDVLLLRFTHEGLLLTFRDGTAALAAVALSPLQVWILFNVFFNELVSLSSYLVQVNHVRLKLKLKTTDWPAAVARDFLLAADNTVPLYTTPGSTGVGAGESTRLVDQDIRVLARLANQILSNGGMK